MGLVALKLCEVQDITRCLLSTYANKLVPLLKCFPRWAWNGVMAGIVHSPQMPLQTYLRYIGKMSCCINHLFLVSHGHATDEARDYTPTKVKETLQTFVTVLRQIGLILDSMSKLGIMPQRSEDPHMVTILDEKIRECMSKDQEDRQDDGGDEKEEDRQDDGSDKEEGGIKPLLRTLEIPLPCYSNYVSKLVNMIGITRHLSPGYDVHPLVAHMTPEQIQEFFTVVFGTGMCIKSEVTREEVATFISFASELLSIYQNSYTSATLPQSVPPLLIVLKELVGCTDKERIQYLLLYLQYHLEKGIAYVDDMYNVFHAPFLKGHYIVPYVAPAEDDADELAPRPQNRSTHVGYTQAILDVVNKIMASSA